MLKKELVWREILNDCFADRRLIFTQKELAGKLKISLSTVHNALKLPRASGAIAVSGRNFRVIDKEKFLLLWATHRRLNRDMIYQTRVAGSVWEIEGRMPPGVVFAAYSAYARKWRHPPADYDVVYVYAPPSLLPEIKRRFPKTKGEDNLFILAADPFLNNYGDITPPVQTFVDLWNLPQWYGADFRRELKEKLKI